MTMNTTLKLFDTTVSHLLTQNKKSISNINYYCYCMYRGSDGLKCAVGCLIKDEYYNASLEGHCLSDTDVLDAVQASVDRNLSAAEIQMLQDLQNIHDFQDPSEWYAALKMLSKTYNLAWSH